MQLVSATAPSAAGFPFPVSENLPANDQSDFMAFLLDATGDLSQPSSDAEQTPNGGSASSNWEEAAELGTKSDKPLKERSVKDRQAKEKEETSAGFFVDPRLLSPQPVHLPLNLTLELASPESKGGVGQGVGEESEQEVKDQAEEARSASSQKPEYTSPLAMHEALSDFSLLGTPAKETSGRPVKTAVPQEFIAAATGIQSSKPQELDLAISLRLAHSFGSDAARKDIGQPGAKQTQSALSASQSLAIPTIQKSPNAKSSNMPQSHAVAAPAAVGTVDQRADLNERQDQRDPRQRQDASKVAPHDSESTQPETVSTNAEPVAALDRASPVTTSNTRQTVERQVVAEPASVRPAEPSAPADAPKAAPLRELTIKVSDNSDQPVVLHIVNEHGKLHVEVRTSDPQLASSLRENVGDLVQKLDRSGFRAESTSSHENSPFTTSSAQGSDLGNAAGHKPGSGEQQNAGQGSDQQSGQQQQQQGQGRGNRPRWLEELVRNFQSSEEKKENAE